MAKSSKNQDEKVAVNPLKEDHSAGSGSYQVVARRYRPKTFEELVGQSHIAQALSNALTSGRVGHAYLFTGARGVGKTSTARIFAKSLNCVQGPTLTPCGVCDSCQSVSTGEDVDVIEIDGASNRGIDEIRQLRQNASICPSRSRYKIYIIDEVHMLTREAFNALLKTLEEPPEHVKFIFCTTEPSKIPITILSRCQRFDFAGIETSSITKRLADIAADEKVTADEGVFSTLARRAAGSMRDAQSLLEQLLSFAPEHISMNDVHEMLGTANDQLLFRLLEAMLRCEPAMIFSELDAAASEGVDFGILTEQLMGLLRDLLVIASGGNASLLLFCTPNQLEQAGETAQGFGLHRILAALQILDQAHNRMRYSTQGRILLELALIRIAHLDHFQMITNLIDQLRQGHLPPQTHQTQVSVKKTITTTQKPESETKPPLSSVKPAQRTISGPAPSTEHGSVPSSASDKTPVKQQSAKQPDPVSDLTPQQRFNATSSTTQTIELTEINNEKAEEIWRDAVDSIPGMLGTWAGKASRISFAAPNLFVAVFENKSAFQFCQQESARIQNTLCQIIGKSVRISVELHETKEISASEPANKIKRSPSRGNLFKDASENAFVRQIEEVFGSELDDVKESFRKES